MSSPWALDRTLRSRYECKYLIDEDLAQEIRHFTSPWMEPDYFTAQQPDRRYAVHSLYLDGPVHELYETTVRGQKNRFKLRIRGYDSRPDSPLFAEVKRRTDRVIQKRRVLVSRAAALAVLRGEAVPDPALAANFDFAEFRSLAARLAARPAVYVSYLREAYEATGPEPARLTFDRALHNAPARLGGEFDFDAFDWRPTPCAKTILELKFTDACPRWIESLVEAFQLDRCSVAKYVLCLEEVRRTRPFAESLHG